MKKNLNSIKDIFGAWGTQGLMGWVGRAGHTCVKNLPRVGVEVCAKFDGDWSGGKS